MTLKSAQQFIQTIHHHTRQPIGNGHKLFIIKNKQAFLYESGNNTLLYTLINRSADVSWIDFYFDNFTFQEIKNNSQNDIEKYLNKHLSVIICKKDKYSFNKFIDWIEGADLSFNNFSNRSVEFAFLQGLEYFHKHYPNTIHEKVNGVNTVFKNAVLRSGSSNKECIQYLLRYINPLDTKEYEEIFLERLQYFLDRDIAKLLMQNNPQFTSIYKNYIFTKGNFLYPDLIQHNHLIDIMRCIDLDLAEINRVKRVIAAQLPQKRPQAVLACLEEKTSILERKLLNQTVQKNSTLERSFKI